MRAAISNKQTTASTKTTTSQSNTDTRAAISKKQSTASTKTTTVPALHNHVSDGDDGDDNRAKDGGPPNGQAIKMHRKTFERGTLQIELNEDSTPCISIYTAGGPLSHIDVTIADSPSSETLGPYCLHKVRIFLPLCPYCFHDTMQMILHENGADVEMFAWTLRDIDWSKYSGDSSLDAHLFRALNRHGELKEMTRNFFKLADSRQVQVSGMFMQLRYWENG